MSDLVPSTPRIPAMGPAAIDKVRRLESLSLGVPQVPIATGHVLHGGMYARTICVPAGVVITGALVEIATLLVIDGDTMVWLDGESVRLSGRHVLPASAGRKQAFAAIADTHITMIFPTRAATVEAAERAFTAEADGLWSRRADAVNHIVVTGE